MKKVIIPIIIVAIIIVALVFAFRGSKMTNDSGSNGGDPVTSQDQGKKMAFSEFLKQGGSYQCTVNQQVGDFVSTGNIYLNDGKVSGEFSTQSSGQTIGGSFVMKDGFVYTWSSVSPTGYKIPVPNQTTSTANTTGSGALYGWNLDQIGDYNCSAWSANTAVFELPAGVTFQELGQ